MRAKVVRLWSGLAVALACADKAADAEVSEQRSDGQCQKQVDVVCGVGRGRSPGETQTPRSESRRRRYKTKEEPSEFQPEDTGEAAKGRSYNGTEPAQRLRALNSAGSGPSLVCPRCRHGGASRTSCVTCVARARGTARVRSALRFRPRPPGLGASAASTAETAVFAARRAPTPRTRPNRTASIASSLVEETCRPPPTSVSSHASQSLDSMTARRCTTPRPKSRWHAAGL